MNRSFALFQTAIGSLAIIWGRQGIDGVRLPEADETALRRRVSHSFPDAIEERPLPGIDLAIRDVRRLLEGERVDLSRIALNMTGVPDFDRRVYEIARGIPAGETRSYGEIARQLGDATLARAVGQALGRNPFPIVVPCHRVLAANGRIGGFSAPGGVTAKLQILAIERARIGSSPSLFDSVGGLPLRRAS